MRDLIEPNGIISPLCRAAVMASPEHDRDWLTAQIATCRRQLAEIDPAVDPVGAMQLAGLIEKWQDRLDSAMAIAGPAEPVGGFHGVGRSTVHSGGRDAAQRAPHAIHASQTSDGFCAWAGLATADVAAIYAAANRVIAEVPSLPLTGTETWVERDRAYCARLCAFEDWVPCGGPGSVEALDRIGARVGLPRARLVPVEG